MLRLLDKPLENVITTGVQAQTVEAMEAALKEDVLAEARAMNGRVLLHDEVMENGNFTVTASWEGVDEHESVLLTRSRLRSTREADQEAAL